MSEEIGHYDTIAEAFLSAGTTMIAIIAGLVPIVRAQSALTERAIALYALTTLLLLIVILLSIFGLVAKGNLSRKRTLSVLPALPLTASVILLLMIILF